MASSHRKCAISDIAITSARNNIFGQDKKQLIGHREGFIYFRSRVGQGACQHPNLDMSEKLFTVEKHCMRIFLADKQAYLEKFKTCWRSRPIDMQKLGAY